MTYLERAIDKGFATLTGEGKQQRIRYIAANRTERYYDPEEQVRAEFWAELIFRHEYPPQRLDLEVIVPRRTPADRADIVVYRDFPRSQAVLGNASLPARLCLARGRPQAHLGLQLGSQVQLGNQKISYENGLPKAL